jgi:hypothetical protein
VAAARRVARSFGLTLYALQLVVARGLSGGSVLRLDSPAK